MNRLSLETCIALKEAGFPQNVEGKILCPNLSELVEELHKANQFASLRFVEDEWIASEWDDVDSFPRKEKGRGATPEIAVANLYLAIN